MSTPSTTLNDTTTPGGMPDPAITGRPPRRLWAAAGVAAGLAAVVGIAASMQIDAVYHPGRAEGDPEVIVYPP